MSFNASLRLRRDTWRVMGFWNAWPTSLAAEAVLGIYVFALVLAGLSDLASLRIPNWLTGAIALAFPISALIVAHGPSGDSIDWLSHIEAAAAVFAGAAVLFACRLLGGGDVKLLAAVALWSGLPMVMTLLFLVAVIGGIFALIVLALRQPLIQASIIGVLRRAPVFLYARMPIPYGVPIAMAGILLAPHLPIFA